MKPTRAGKLRRRVTLQQLPEAESLDSFGQPIRDYQDVGTYWGSIEPLSGREAEAAGQLRSEATHLLTVRYLGADVTPNPTDRWVYDGRTFGVVAIRNVEERNRRYEIDVREIQGRTTRV